MINLQLVDTTTHNNNNNKNCNTKEEVSKVFLEYSKRQEKLCQLKIEPFVIFFFQIHTRAAYHCIKRKIQEFITPRIEH